MLPAMGDLPCVMLSLLLHSWHLNSLPSTAALRRATMVNDKCAFYSMAARNGVM